MTTTHHAPDHSSDPLGVLIVGAGPTGLTLAIELARRSIPYRLIDKAPSRPVSSRAIGTQARTMETFQIMGIPETALEPAARPRGFRFAERGRTLARVAFDSRSSGGRTLISMDQADTERVLERRLTELGGHTERGVELLRFRVEDGGVVATLRGPAGGEEVRACFLVGADGAHSTVRQVAGIEFAGATYPERFLLADLDLDWDLPHDEGHVWIGDEGLVAAIPLPGERRFRLIVPLPPEEAAREFSSEREIAAQAEALLRQRTSVRLRRVGDPIWASSFRIHRRQAARYRQGPVFLAGDAAHVHSPIGGQGMNMGIQDAFNLGWKLALAVQREAAPGLLDTYEDERHPIARGILRGTDIGTRLVLARNPVMRALRELIVPAAFNLKPIRRQIFEAISQVGLGYRGSPLSIDAAAAAGPRGTLRRSGAGIRAGDRVPDVSPRLTPDGPPVQLFALIAQGWLLLLFPGHDPVPQRLAALDALAAEAHAAVGGRVAPYLVLHAPPPDVRETPILLDPAGELERTFGARPGLVALVRPDGYLGYRGLPAQRMELASYLARVYAMRLPTPDRQVPP